MSEQKKEQAERTYTVEMGCSNCGVARNQSFVHGKEVPKKVICPNCGCYSMTKTYKGGNDFAKCLDVFFNGRSAD